MYRKLLVVWVAMATVATTPAAMAQAPCRLTLQGRVVDDHTRQPLEGASVQVAGLDRLYLSDSSGQFRIEGLCPGQPYQLTISHVSCKPQQVNLTLRGNLSRLFLLHHEKLELEGVTVRGQRVNATQVTQQVSRADLVANRGLNLGEALRNINGVTLLNTGSTISKPVIHGLHSNRILMLNNGIRQEGQQWGAEHAPEIDPFVAGRLSVIKGAAAVRYGADAIAGVVMVDPKALPAQTGLQGEVNLAAFSNNLMGVANAMLESRSRRDESFAWRLQATGKRGGNTRIPGYWLRNTGVGEFNYSAAAAYKRDNWGADLFFSAFQSDIGLYPGAHVETIDDLNQAIASKTPLPAFQSGFDYAIERPRQEVRHYLGRMTAFYKPSASSRFSLQLSHQENFRDEYDARAFIPQPEMSLNLGTTGAELLFEKNFRQQHQLQLGLWGQRQENVNGEISARQFIRNYIAWNYAGFAIWQTSIDRTDLEAGLRYDHRWFESYYRPPGASEIVVHNRQFTNVSGSAGFTRRLGSHWRVKGNVASAWRPPAPNELYANGVHQGLASFEIGNQDFRAERALNMNLEWHFQTDSAWRAGLTLYHNRIADFIYLAPTPPPILTIRGFYPVFTYRQADATFTGMDFDAEYSFRGTGWSVSGKWAALWARNRTLNDWLILMPANRLEIGLEHQPKRSSGRWMQEYRRLQWIWVDRQRRIPAASVEADYAPPPAAYALLHADWGITSRKSGWEYGLSIQNALNARYRDYLNRLRYFADQAGMNVQLRLRIPLGKQIVRA